MTNLENKIANVSRLGITCIKNAENPYFNSKYADLSTVVEALKKPLEENKIGYYFMSTGGCEHWMLTLTIVNLEEVDNEEAEQTTDSLVLAFPLNPVDPQKMGASISYAKRYLLCTAFNVIAEEDDDGNEASGNKPTLPKKKPVALQTKQQPKTIDDIDDEVPSFFK
jgi:hypothetical protein